MGAACRANTARFSLSTRGLIVATVKPILSKVSLLWVRLECSSSSSQGRWCVMYVCSYRQWEKFKPFIYLLLIIGASHPSSWRPLLYLWTMEQSALRTWMWCSCALDIFIICSQTFVSIGDKPLFEPMLVNLLTHVCATRVQWVNSVTPRLWIG